jgi:hypothetical protein
MDDRRIQAGERQAAATPVTAAFRGAIFIAEH